jgi:hypothetical protein
MTFVHGVRLLLSKFDRARPLRDLLGNDVTAFVQLEQQEGVIGIGPLLSPNHPTRLLSTNSPMRHSTWRPNVSHEKRVSSCSFPSALLSSFILCELEYQDGHFSASMMWSHTVLQEAFITISL